MESGDSPDYWLFVPSNPDGLFKNVFTNSVNVKEPFRTEVGVTAGDTTGLERQWAMYTMVLTADSISSYLNGELVGTAAKSCTTKDFGSDLLVYLGRSGYAKDKAFAGCMKDLRIYEGALTQAQIQAQYEAGGLRMIQKMKARNMSRRESPNTYRRFAGKRTSLPGCNTRHRHVRRTA